MNGLATTELRHGYTVADLDQLTRHAIHRAGPFGCDIRDRYEAAWGAIVEHLYRTDTWPSYPVLLRTGWLAIYILVRDDHHHWGYYDYAADSSYHGPRSGPRFGMFWDQRNTDGSYENGVVDRIALYQILPTLGASTYAALVALAIHGDYHAGAEALGISYSAFKQRIINARAEFKLLWHEGETPSTAWGIDRRAGRNRDERRTGSGRKTVVRMRMRKQRFL
jgi:hypothetical protein